MATDINKQWYGFNPPFFGGQQGVFSRQSGLRLIKNDLQQLILTSLGERIMRPTFGTPLRETVFANAAPEDAAIAADGIQEAIETFDPRVRSTVNYEIDDENQKIRFIVRCRYNNAEIEDFELVLET